MYQKVALYVHTFWYKYSLCKIIVNQCDTQWMNLLLPVRRTLKNHKAHLHQDISVGLGCLLERYLFMNVIRIKSWDVYPCPIAVKWQPSAETNKGAI